MHIVVQEVHHVTNAFQCWESKAVMTFRRCRGENAGFLWSGAQRTTDMWASEARKSGICRPAGLNVFTI